MTLSSGSRLGPYEILSPLGAGGMGEVYKARDTRLGRTVAVKVLPDRLSSDAELRQRFEREARTISQLSHPHICALYDVGHQDGTEYLVMEYLEGQTLSEKLAKGALPVDQALRYGIEIADALQTAHRHGIVHRDLKPGNVVITKSGVKLLDFGLAKVLEPAAPTTLLTALPTETPLTEKGAILGTVQYMAPEQLEGKEADARTDIFALGAVIHEMATGRKAFSGASQASLISSIMTAEPPPISGSQPLTPPGLDRVVKLCLAKDPDARWQTAHDVKLQLDGIAPGEPAAGWMVPVPAAPERKRRELVAWGIAALAVGLAAWSWFQAARRPQPAARPVRFSVLPPPNTVFHSIGPAGGGPVTVSPDGRHLVFNAVTADGKRQLWLRSLDSISARPLPGTEDGSFPFWSPDSRHVAFFGQGELRKLDISGGPPVTICAAPDGRGGSWGGTGTIVFAPANFTTISSVSSAGGTPQPVTRIDASRFETTHRWPSFLPDGRHFLYFAGSHVSLYRSRDNAVRLASLDSRDSQVLIPTRSAAVYSSGHLLFARGTTLLAQPFDPDRLKLSGEPFPVAEGVPNDVLVMRALFSASDDGTLAFHGGGSALSRLVWLDRTGKEIGAVGAPADYARPRLSPDGQRLAVEIWDASGSDLWLMDFSRGSTRRFTFSRSEEIGPVWSPDGRSVFFESRRLESQVHDFFVKPVAGEESERVIVSAPVLGMMNDWSPDGRLVLLQTFGIGTNTAWDLSVLSLPDAKVTKLRGTPSLENVGDLSPDGHWIAYQSNETGRFEIYVEAFPGPGGRWQVSNAGGEFARWRADGRELYYLAPGGRFMVVPIHSGESIEAGTPKILFQARVKRFFGGAQYDASPDGQRFIINMSEEDPSLPITVVLDWPSAAAKEQSPR